ncbi:DUF4129 domain-containing transglutaminase family protein, partial [Chloroflexota bacterium]
LLVGMMNMTRQHYWFKKHDSTYPNRAAVYFMSSLLCLSTLAVSSAWLTPEIRVNRLERLVSTKMPLRKNIEEYVTNFLAAVPAKQPFLKSSEQRELLFGDSFGQGDELQFIITSEQPFYWRTRTYDIYTSLGWSSSNFIEYMLWQGISSSREEEVSKRSEITYAVVPKLRTDIVLTTGEFASSDTPVSVQFLAPMSFDIDLLHPTDDRSLPPDVASLARLLRAAQVADKELSQDGVSQLLPEDLVTTGIGTTRYSSEEADYTPEPILDSARLTTVKLTRMQVGPRNTIAITTPLFLTRDQRYRANVSIISATPSDLSEAGDDYPHWVTDYYLQLPPTLPERVRQLSEIVTEEALSPYSKVLAIKDYLSRFAYTIEVEPPPQGADGVDYFLFTQKSGNCVHFASAMVVMLRSVGVPSRLSSGYSPGGWDAVTGSSTLQAEDRHTWPEVYFPGYGWVEFEPTPAIENEIAAMLAGGGGFEALPWWLDDENEEDWLQVLRSVRELGPQEREEWLGFMGWDENELAKWLEWLDQQEQLTNGIVYEDLIDDGVDTTTGNQLWRILPFIISGLVLFVVALWAYLFRRRWRSVRSDYASEIYRKMCFLASLVRLSPKPQRTPLEYCAILTSVFPVQAEALDNIVQAYIESRFSRRRELGHWQRGRLQKSWNRVYPALLKRLFRL